MHRVSQVVSHLNPVPSSEKFNYCDILSATCCAKLSQWVYNVSEKNKLPIHPCCTEYCDKSWDIKHTEQGESENNITSYSVLSPKILDDTLYLVFCGTKLNEQPLDVIADLCAIPQPSSDPFNNKAKIISIHSGVYSKIKRDFHDIHTRFLSSSKLKNIKNIIITGHSLGGGLAILFAYNSLRYNKLDNINLKVITFGSPMVFAEKTSNSDSSHPVIYKLSKICHNFVNLYDAVPRLPGSTHWVNKVLPNAIEEYIGKWNMMYAKTVSFGKLNPNKLLQKLNNQQTIALFSHYFPFGTYYFLGENGELSIATKFDEIKTNLYKNPPDCNSVINDHFIESYIQILNKMNDGGRFNMPKQDIIHIVNNFNHDLSNKMKNNQLLLGDIIRTNKKLETQQIAIVNEMKKTTAKFSWWNAMYFGITLIVIASKIKK